MKNSKSTHQPRSPEIVKKVTPGSRDKKRKGRKEAVERSRARAEKNGRVGLGGDGDVEMDDGQQTPRPHPTHKPRHPKQATADKSPKTKRTDANGRMHPHETGSDEDEEESALPSALQGQEIEDLDYGQGEIDEDELERAVEGRDWWEDEEEDEEEEEVRGASPVRAFLTL